MQIILVRHAKAERWQPDQSDFNRVLIQEGIQRLQAKLPTLLDKLSSLQRQDSDKLRRITMWVSPSARTMETASIIREILEVADLKECDWIWNQDTAAFVRSLEELDDDALIMTVGHQPSLSHWSEIMTGNSIPFRTSGVVSFVKQAGERDWHVNWELP